MSESETDLLLDWFLDGKSPQDFAAKSGMPVESVKAAIRRILTNEKNAAHCYRPQHKGRKDRSALPMNERDKRAMADLKAAGMPPVVIARVLSRAITQVGGKHTTKEEQGKAPKVSSADYLLALRYAFHIYKFRLVSDKEYDGLMEEEKEFGAVNFLKETSPKAVSRRIKTLALYLSEKYLDDNGHNPPEVP